MAICCTCCSQMFDDYKDSCEILTKPACLCLNLLLENGAIILYIYYYFAITNMLREIKDDPDLCGNEYVETMEESGTYLNDFESFPLQYTLHVYIAQIISFCCIGYFTKSMLDDNSDNFDDKYANSADNNSVAVSSYAMSSNRTITRPAYTNTASNSYNPRPIHQSRPTARPATTNIANSNSRAIVPARRVPSTTISTRTQGGGSSTLPTEDDARAAVLVSALAITLFGFEFVKFYDRYIYII